MRAMRSESRSLVLHPSGTDSASESVSSAQHRSTARLALSRLAARLARVRQRAHCDCCCAATSCRPDSCWCLATYARTLVTARTRSVAASSRGRACVRRDAVCGQSAPPRLSRIDAAVHTARGTCETEASPAAELLASAPTLCRPAQARRPLRQG